MKVSSNHNLYNQVAKSWWN